MAGRSPSTITRRALGAGALGLASAVLAACSSGDGLPDSSDSDKNYIEGDGSWAEVKVADRTDPVEFSGTTADGTKVDLSQYRGKVVVLNTWFASCSPCRKEAPDLESVWQEYSSRNVQFLGINTYDTADIVTAFQRTFGISYPSVLDKDSGAAMIALRKYSPQATPTTIVLDTEGRVAGRASGIVAPSTLSGMLDDAGATPATTSTSSPTTSGAAS